MRLSTVLGMNLIKAGERSFYSQHKDRVNTNSHAGVLPNNSGSISNYTRVKIKHYPKQALEHQWLVLSTRLKHIILTPPKQKTT